MNQFIFRLDIGKNDILDKDNTIITSSSSNLPLISLGYHYYIKKTKDAFPITIKNLDTKNEFYYVVNPYEPKILNYNDSLINLSKEYLKIKEDIDHNFLIIWEILFLFDLIKKDCNCISLGNDDFIFGIKKFNDKLLDKKVKIVIKDTAELIVCNECKDNEIDNYKILLENIIKILKLQDKKGNMIIKIMDTYTIPTLKMIYLVTSFYEESYIFKPLFSRPTTEDKYLICKNYKGRDDKKISNLEKVYNSIIKLENEYIFDIFNNLVLSKDYLDKFKFINIKISNLLQIMINDIIIYIKDNNYFGNKYHLFRDTQIEMTKQWITNFYPPSKNIYEKNRGDLEQHINNLLEKYKIEQNKFITNLIR